MQKVYFLIAMSAAVLAGCQSVQPFNGTSGYQIEQHNQVDQQAILSYTLTVKNPNELPEQKLKASCQKALKSNKPFNIQVLSQHEIAYPQQETQQGFHFAKHGVLSTAILNHPHQHDPYSTHHTASMHPSTLTVIRYRCI